MVSTEFVVAVAKEMKRVLDDPSDTARLGLAGDIIRGWQGYFANDNADAMVEKIKTVARDNKIPLDQYEPGQARAAAELTLSTVDAFYRKMVAPRTMT